MNYALDRGCWYEKLWGAHRDDDTFKGDLLAMVEGVPVDTTEDCVDFLNTHVAKGKWKRTCKAAFKGNPARTFEDKNTGKIVTVYIFDDLVCAADFDLKGVKAKADQILKFSQHYASADGFNIYFNPKTDSVFYSFPDCFPFYIKNPLDKDQTSLEILRRENVDDDADWLDDKGKLIENVLPFLKEAMYLDESGPEPWAGYIEIGYRDGVFADEDFTKNATYYSTECNGETTKVAFLNNRDLWGQVINGKAVSPDVLEKLNGKISQNKSFVAETGLEEEEVWKILDDLGMVHVNGSYLEFFN